MITEVKEVFENMDGEKLFKNDVLWQVSYMMNPN